MRVGKMLVICVGDEIPDWKAYRLDEVFGVQWDLIFDWHEWRKPENHMKIVKENENYDLTCRKGRFSMHEDFNICLMARYTKEDDFMNLCESAPHHCDFMRIAITNV